MFRFRDEGYNIRLVDIDTEKGTLGLQYFTGSHCVCSEEFTLEELNSIQDDDVRLLRLRDYGSITLEHIEDDSSADDSEDKPYQFVEHIERAISTLSEILNYADPTSPVNEGAGGISKMPHDVVLAMDELRSIVDEDYEKKLRNRTTLTEILEAAERMTDELQITEHFFTNHELTVRQLLKASLEELDTVFDYAVSIRDGLRSIVGEETPDPIYQADLPF